MPLMPFAGVDLASKVEVCFENYGWEVNRVEFGSVINNI